MQPHRSRVVQGVDFHRITPARHPDRSTRLIGKRSADVERIIAGRAANPRGLMEPLIVETAVRRQRSPVSSNERVGVGKRAAPRRHGV